MLRDCVGEVSTNNVSAAGFTFFFFFILLFFFGRRSSTGSPCDCKTDHEIEGLDDLIFLSKGGT